MASAVALEPVCALPTVIGAAGRDRFARIGLVILHRIAIRRGTTEREKEKRTHPHAFRTMGTFGQMAVRPDAVLVLAVNLGHLARLSFRASMNE